jgi:hypothetical protein
MVLSFERKSWSMTRQHIEKPILVEAINHSIKYKCDFCGTELDHDGMDDMFPNELIVLLNQDECVSNRFRRDLCNSCLDKIWNKICKLIRADPDDISGKDFWNE